MFKRGEAAEAAGGALGSSSLAAQGLGADQACPGWRRCPPKRCGASEPASLTAEHAKKQENCGSQAA